MQEPSDSSPALRVSARLLALTTCVLAALWALDLFVLKTSLLAHVRDKTPLTPYYAIWAPYVRSVARFAPLAILAGTLVALAPRLVDPERTSAGRFALASFAFAAALAFALFLLREDPAALGGQFNLYQDEEFWHDALRVTRPAAFLEHYVQLMPRLSLHGKHYPPGNALLLNGVIALCGPHVLAAGITVLAFAAAAIVLAWIALRELCGERAARQGALLVACAPAFLDFDFACTAMDAVFLFWAVLAWWLALRAVREPTRVARAALAGLVLLVATLFSFSAFPLGLAIAVFALVSLRARAWWPLVLIGATYVAAALVLRFASGFALWDCVAEGSRSAREFMARVGGGRPTADRLHISYGNPIAYSIGAGAPLVAACVASLRAHRFTGSRWKIAALATLAVMSWAPLFYLETERIWLFTLPWLAALALCDEPLDARSFRLLAGASIVQAAVMEALLFTIW